MSKVHREYDLEERLIDFVVSVKTANQNKKKPL